MPSRISEIVFSEPSGRLHSIVMFASAVLFLGLYGYVHADTSAEWLLVMAAGNVLSGVAESLPADRRRAAGAFRIAAVSVFLCLLIAMVVAPEFVFE
ncbi:hypothetical protein B4589_010440 [Halolamina sp. CBA1230]|uniref:hypothetical protein n=1 Tax=Halolamina sp. CBA1230 TaxID=1853690 RepID=UPI0009A1C1EE|nr:hypothetical protein [Halolamina sp. CBA1230]QKY20774.1 hypothetical protein B4589_010440 [Halolamina sp. CBA1230]